MASLLARVKEYLDDGRHAQVRTILGGRLSMNTVRNWIADPIAAAYANSAAIFMELGKYFPPIDKPESEAYSFITKQMGFDNSIQHLSDIRKYNGSYTFFHSIKIQFGDSIKNIHIRLDDENHAATFIFRYLPVGGARRTCDGFVFRRNQRLFLIGLSPSSVLYATINAVVDPEGELMYGVMAFEDIDHQKVIVTPIVLLKGAQSPNEIQRQSIEKYLESVPADV